MGGTMKIRAPVEIIDNGEDIYSENGREQLIDSDEISDFEEAFMRGYEEGV